MSTPTFTASQTPKPARALTAEEVNVSMRAARAADCILTIDSPIHYFTVIVPYVEPKRATEWHPDRPGEKLSRGAFPSLDVAVAWATNHLAGTPYGVTEVGWDEERGDWSEIAKFTPVCPRCLDLTPGEAGGDPAHSHPGPLTEAPCLACSLAVETALRSEGRTEAAYLDMLAADVAGENAAPHIRAASAALRAAGDHGSGTPAQRNRALVAGCSPLTPSERNAALVGRRSGS